MGNMPKVFLKEVKVMRQNQEEYCQAQEELENDLNYSINQTHTETNQVNNITLSLNMMMRNNVSPCHESINETVEL